MSKKTLVLAIMLASFAIVSTRGVFFALPVTKNTVGPPSGDGLRSTYEEDLRRIKNLKEAKDLTHLARIIHEGASRGQERGVRVAVCERDRRATSLRDFWCWILVRAQFYTELRWIEEKSWPWSGGGRRL